jgi:hypothetical protein
MRTYDTSSLEKQKVVSDMLAEIHITFCNITYNSRKYIKGYCSTLYTSSNATIYHWHCINWINADFS